MTNHLKQETMQWQTSLLTNSGPDQFAHQVLSAVHQTVHNQPHQSPLSTAGDTSPVLLYQTNGDTNHRPSLNAPSAASLCVTGSSATVVRTTTTTDSNVLPLSSSLASGHVLTAYESPYQCITSLPLPNHFKPPLAPPPPSSSSCQSNGATSGLFMLRSLSSPPGKPRPPIFYLLWTLLLLGLITLLLLLVSSVYVYSSCKSDLYS